MNRSFSDLLMRAINEDHEALGEILDMYMPLINRHSRIHGRIDEDCRQYIMLRIISSMTDFVI